MKTLRVLVAIASYGERNREYLRKVIDAYRAMTFQTDIVVVSNIPRSLGPDVECRVGLPDRNPWSLPFAHKAVFAERADAYDLFIYSEDDILISQRNLDAWLEVDAGLRDDEVAGFLRVEYGAAGEVNFPDAHAWFHWDVGSVRRRGQTTLAAFTNAHAACYVLNRAQLARALASGGFAAGPHEGEYDLLCTAATDAYTQCGLTKLIPISRLEDFTVHHMSNRYVGGMGVSGETFARQTQALMRLADAPKPARPLLAGQTAVWRAGYSKDFYEPLNTRALAAVPTSARSVLSLGCGAGATEIALVQKGLRVTALPLDPVIAAGACDLGVEMIEGELDGGLQHLSHRRFDVIFVLNVLHLVPDPAGTLAQMAELLADGGIIVVQSPNMINLPAVWRQLRHRRLETPTGFDASGAHLTSGWSLRRWRRKAGLVLQDRQANLHPRLARLARYLPALFKGPFADEFLLVAQRRSRSKSRAAAVAQAPC